ncbi:MAG: hypothetical protein ACP5HZ_09550 [Ferrimicrobium sp.]|uniref:hypothetical protein n=1 Tax=Ferrimicrobium sp. TaxID=2926050 RepID=UPI00262F3245|nr:hypothetical protein [Ferrimicrobium sp.]
MTAYRPPYRRAFTIPVVLAVLFILVGLVLGQTLGSHERLVNQRNECRAQQVSVTETTVVPATSQHASFAILTITPRRGVACTLAGYPTLVTPRLSDIVVTHLGPQFGLTPVTLTATSSAPDRILISPATTPYGLRLPNTDGLVIVDHHAKPTITHYSMTPIFASKDTTTIRALATTDLKPSHS